MKIVVYAICKNEAGYAERWMASMAEADGVYVLDTGSTDGTAERLRALGAVVVEERVEPWRFDTARNRSLELVPEDADICVCTDLDEVFHPGWRQEGWGPGRKCTAEGVQLDHHADPAKSRGQYLPLLELSVAEAPEDDRNTHYLGREYLFYGRWDDCIRTLERHLSLPTAVWADERCASMRFLARAWRQKGRPEQARRWLWRAIGEAPHLREPYLELARLLYEEAEWDGVVYLCRQALAITDRPQTYICEAEAWGSLPWDLLSLGLYHTGRRGEALEAARQALALSPEDGRIRDNVAFLAG